MLSFFRNNRFLNSVLLLPYVVLLRCFALPGGFPGDIPSKGMLSQWMVGDMFHSSTLSVIIGIILVYFQALQLNRVVIQNRMTYDLTLFPGMMYVLLVSYFPAYNGLSSPLIANTFILIALESLFATHKKSGSAGRIFDAGLWLAMAGLFYFGYSILVLFGIVGLSALRTLKSQEWLQYFIGYITPISIFAMLDFVLHGDLTGLAAHFSANMGTLDFQFTGLSTFINIGFFALLLLVSLISFGSFKQRKNIHTQKKVDLLMWLLFFGFSIVLIQARIGVSDWIVLTIPLACFVAMIIAQSTQFIIFEVVHFLFLSGSIAMQLWWIISR
ncbi:MAG TPA: hypothetical protein VI603_16235 [Saprospiraceae bacterium]|nr:hypothetical protein [Saprospiraceae bacterium]